jgi:thiosulfate/3-mercaptopyruvate sulfurtransferase
MGDVRLLDGAWPAWTEAGLPTSTDDVVPGRGGVTLRSGHLPTIDAESARAFDGVLLDARAAERYRGETEPVDPRAGHIPGAVSAPTSDNLGADGRFLTPAALRDRFARLGADPTTPVGVYCGSGVTAAHEIAALAIAGIDAALYPGSWSQWSSNLDLPVATGERP